MRRTIINLDEKDKAWLDRHARDQKMSMTEVVRRAVRLYRTQQESRLRSDLRDVLKRTSGIWKRGDALAYQRGIRDEWGRTK